MKKFICIALAAVLAMSLAACGNSDSLSGKVATDGSTSMEKVIGALKETFEGENIVIQMIGMVYKISNAAQHLHTAFTKLWQFRRHRKQHL